jgi:hypothetical protein
MRRFGLVALLLRSLPSQVGISDSFSDGGSQAGEDGDHEGDLDGDTTNSTAALVRIVKGENRRSGTFDRVELRGPWGGERMTLTSFAMDAETSSTARGVGSVFECTGEFTTIEVYTEDDLRNELLYDDV